MEPGAASLFGPGYSLIFFFFSYHETEIVRHDFLPLFFYQFNACLYLAISHAV